jgi:thymidylate synthase
MMKYGTLVQQTATEAWEALYSELCGQAESGFVQPSRAGNVVGEILNAVTVIENPRKGTVLSPIRNMSVDYARGEFLWYLSGSNMLSAIHPYSKAWDKLTDDGDTVNSAYGHRIRHRFGFDQYAYCLEKLRANPYDRQALIHIKDASNTLVWPSKDVPCTVCLQYQIRDEKLYATTYMRSNDIWLGFPYDVFAFTSYQCMMAMELGVDVGAYTHIAGSLHLYEKDWRKHEGQPKNNPEAQ